MTPTISRRAHAADMTMLVLFIAPFPVMSALHARISNQLYHVLAGVLLGGIAALSQALLHDGFVRWRHAGVAGIDWSRSLRFSGFSPLQLRPSLTACEGFSHGDRRLKLVGAWNDTLDRSLQESIRDVNAGRWGMKSA